MKGIPGFIDSADAIVDCKVCGVAPGKPCRSMADNLLPTPGTVHLGRRVRRLMLTARAPHERTRIERELVAELRRELVGGAK